MSEDVSVVLQLIDATGPAQASAQASSAKTTAAYEAQSAAAAKLQAGAKAATTGRFKDASLDFGHAASHNTREGTMSC